MKNLSILTWNIASSLGLRKRLCQGSTDGLLCADYRRAVVCRNTSRHWRFFLTSFRECNQLSRLCLIMLLLYTWIMGTKCRHDVVAASQVFSICSVLEPHQYPTVSVLSFYSCYRTRLFHSQMWRMARCWHESIWTTAALLYTVNVGV